MQVATKRLGLAAYMMMNGAEFIKHTEGRYVFQSDKPGKEWRTSYAKSKESRFNATLIELQHLRKES